VKANVQYKRGWNGHRVVGVLSVNA